MPSPRSELLDAASGGPWQYSTAFPADLDAFGLLHGLLDRLRDDHPVLVPEDRLSFRTAVAELVANVVDHAAVPDGGLIQVAASVTPSEIRGVVVAPGPPVPAPTDDVAEVPDDAERGRGLHLVGALAHVTTTHLDGTNTWYVVRPRSDR